MASEILMPKMSDTMEEGKILRWLKKPGEPVAVGDVLAEVETDKADMELEAETEGVLAEIVVEEGRSAAVGDVLARLGASSETAAGRGDGGSGATTGAKRGAPAEEHDEEPEELGIVPESRRPRAAGSAAPVEKSAQGALPDRERGSSAGSGPGGRTVSRDRSAGPAAKPSTQPPLRPATRPPGPRAAAGRREELSKIRRTVARRMAESKREAPHFYMTAEIEMTECARLKDALAAARPEGPTASYTHVLLRAVALALREHPRINARYVSDDAIEHNDDIHLGIAVALEEGLIVPVLHDCGDKTIYEIAAEARALVERVRSGKAAGEDLSGGTFTVSNLGMFPIDEFAAVINPPQAAVLAVGAVLERPIARDGHAVVARTMRVTLSSDHRVIDGAEAARFLATLKGLLENPVRLVL